MIITLITQGKTFENIITSLLFYNINLDTEKYKICIICSSKIKEQINDYIIKLKFEIIYEIIDFENSFDFYKKLYAIQRKLIIEYGKILMIDTRSILINNIDISDSLLEQKIIVVKNNDIINKKMFYISDIDIFDRFVSEYNHFSETTDISSNRLISAKVFEIEEEIIKEIYEENDYEYFEQNHIMSSLYQFTEEGNENNYINWNKMLFKDKPIQFYDIEIVYNPYHNKLLSHVVNQIVKQNTKYYYIFLITRNNNNNISIPIRSSQYGYWEKDNNNSFDFILKDFVKKNNDIFLFNFLRRFSNSEFLTNNVIYDKKDSLLLDKYTLTYHNIFLINTNKTVTDLLESINKSYLFLGYIPYCKPLLDEYIDNIESYEKHNDIAEI